MNEQKLVWKIYDQRLASADIKTAGELHPSNRNEEKPEPKIIHQEAARA